MTIHIPIAVILLATHLVAFAAGVIAFGGWLYFKTKDMEKDAV